MQYISTQTIESKLFPGVTYSLNRMSVARRISFTLAMATYLSQQRDIWTERQPIESELLQIINQVRASKDPPEPPLPLESTITARLAARASDPDIEARFPVAKAQALVDLLMKEQRLDLEEMQPALVRWALKSIDSLEIDGQPATIDSLLESGPAELVSEIASEASRVMQLSGPDAKNSPSPTISGAPAGEPTSVSTALSADSKAST